jgi:hypothetical protein
MTGILGAVHASEDAVASWVIQVIGSIIATLVGAFVVQHIIARREKANRATQFFYDLMSHLHEFEMAFHASASHSRRFHEHLTTAERYDDRTRELQRRTQPFGPKPYGSTREQSEQELRDIAQWRAAESLRLNTESVEIHKEREGAIAKLRADSMLAKMLFTTTSRPLVEQITSLIDTAAVFKGRSPDYKEYSPHEEALPAKIESVHAEIRALWEKELADPDAN